jgi:outer membrane protein assembly factor BamD
MDDAQFKIAYCDYKLSPKPSLDQTYTVKAVENFQRFIEDFPQSDLAAKAETLLKVCRTKLAEKEYKAGELYMKLRDYHGAHVYFGSVIDNYYDTGFVEDATYWKAESLYRLRKDSEARAVFEELLRKFPETKHKKDVKKRLEEIETELLKSKTSVLSSGQ